MLKKKLMSLGIAVVFALSSLTTTVFAADFNKAATGASVTVKFTNPGKGNGNDKDKKFKFDDSKDVSWALNAIEKLAGKGILGGIGQGKFAPQNKVTQLEALAMVLRLTGDNDEADSKKNQVHPLYKGQSSNWGLGYIFVAIEKKILLPEELGSFNPNTPAKRHEIAKYIVRAMGKTNDALKHMDEDLSFKDSSAVPEKSVGYVYLVNELKIMTGNNNMFKPMEPVTRAEMAVLLDRADGKITLPDTDTKKNGIVFVSADVDDNEITVKVKGTSVTYDFVEGVQVYRKDCFETIEDLVAGDVLQLIFNDKKEIIFIDVVKDAENDEVEETELSVTSVDYEDLPEVLQDKVDDLKSTKNYKVYEYNDYIYLLATMGKKNTGGYDIDFEDVYKVEKDDDFIVKAVIDTDEPDSDDIVTQADTYPYSVVKFKSFDDIDFVRFVDGEDDKLAEVEIANVDEASIVEGEIYDLIDSSKTIKVEKANGTKVSYTVPSSAEIIVNSDDDAEFSDLEEGMSVKVEINDDKVVKVTAEDYEEDELSVEAVDYSDLSDKLKDQVDYLKLSKNYKAYEYDNYVYLIATMGKKTSSGYEIDIDKAYKLENSNNFTIKAVIETESPSTSNGTTSYPYSIVKFKEFDDIEAVRFVDEDNNKLAEAKIVELDEVVKVEGTISTITASSRTIKVQKSNGSVVTLTIPTDAEITVNDDEDESFSDLVKGMKIEVEITDERVTQVIAEDTITEVEGILTGISIST
ncbi:MAG TPA: S-layer homology domain-containing protein, partial [Patescibacteria group bacterium]|nr:S-layer homology domain-containing protein [Patescibacteria group bacterium]